MFFAMATIRIIRCCFIFIITTGSSAFAQVGFSCRTQQNAEGTCRMSADCRIAQEQAQQGITPVLCGYSQSGGIIVCCENTGSDVEPNDNSFLNPDSKPVDSFVYPEDEQSSQREPYVGLSEQKCEQYSKNVTDEIQALPLLTDPETISVSIVKCDYNGVALIVGGKPAQPGEFPFMVAIGFNNNGEIEWKCGGTLISENYVLTAAHCTFSRDDDSPSIVRLGDLDLRRDDDGSVFADYNIADITVHPSYRYPQRYHDIALLRLQGNVQFSKFIRPACLYTRGQVEQTQAIATGWGKTDYAAAEISDKLMKVSLNIYHNDQCKQIYTPNKNLPKGISSKMICAGELKGGQDTCQGDSGGPLLITKKGNRCKFYIIGVTSFGKSCGQANTPAVYTKVSEYVPWIEKTIW